GVLRAVQYRPGGHSEFSPEGVRMALRIPQVPARGVPLVPSPRRGPRRHPSRPGEEIPGSMNYVRVDDLDAASRKIERAGGAIVLPRVDIPGMGSFFWFRIPGGPILAAWQDAPALPEEREE